MKNTELKANELETLFNSLNKRGRFNGNVLIAEKGNIIFKKSFGYSDFQAKIPLNTSTTFELGSVTKQFTAFAILKLAMAKKISLHDDFTKYLPELNFYKNISIYNLLTHTSGLVEFGEVIEKYCDLTKVATNETVIEMFAKHKPEVLFKANDKMEYSNTGFVFLASIIERVSKQKYDDFLNETIFEPLRMKNSFLYLRHYKPKELTNSAIGCLRSSITHKKVRPETDAEFADSVYLGGVYGDGMVNSNLDDLFLWDRALYNDKFVSESERKLIFTSAILNNGKEGGYGLGWRVRKSTKYAEKLAYHTGNWIGFLAYIERQMVNDKTIILLQNYNRGVKPVNKIREILAK